MRAVMLQRNGARVFENRVFIEALPTQRDAEPVMCFGIVVIAFDGTTENSLRVFEQAATQISLT
jgi:hypothetical protein